METNIYKNLFKNCQLCKCSDGAELYFSKNSDEKSYFALICELKALGYEAYAEREIGKNRFATLVGASKTLTVYYIPCEKTLRMVSEEGISLPPRDSENSYIPVTTPLITQKKTSNLQNNCGMSYIIRLSDGRFIIIDGGFDEYEEAENLVRLIEEQNTLQGKPIIAAVFITHSHNDHIGALTGILQRYSDRLVFGDFIFNWPNEKLCYMIPVASHAEFDEALRGILGARIIHARSGQRFYYADAVIDILFTPDDLYPELIHPFNNSSLIMMMNLSGKRIFFTADSGVTETARLISRYGEFLKCHILQVAHHGYGGGSTELYSLAEPQVLLWPAPNYWYEIVKAWETNEYFKQEKFIGKTFVSGKGSVSLDLSLPLDEAAAKLNPTCAKLPYRADFCGRVTDLGWTAVMVGSKKLMEADLTFKSGECLWRGVEIGRTLLEILPPDVLDNAEGYKLKLSGKAAEDNGSFGILFNLPRPIDVADTDLLPVPIEKGDFDILLSVDKKGRLFSLEYNGRTLVCEKYTPASGCGLYLSLTVGEISLYSVEVTSKNAESKE